MNINKF